jgi:hypothetical protein
VINKLLSSLVPIICGAIWLSVIDRVDAKGKEKDWITLDSCQLVPNKANDGDSFHVRRMTPSISSDSTLLMRPKRRASVRRA